MKQLLTIGLVLTVFTATACGGDDDQTATDTTAPAAAPSATAPASEFADADVAFAQDMIPHHAQAIEMAEIALDPAAAAGPDVLDLATRVRDAQDPEIELMRTWLDHWGMPMTDEEMEAMGGMDGTDHSGMDHSGMDGMMTAAEMDELRNASGADFDRLWLELMIRHHEGAITMAEAVKVNGVNDDAIELADEIIAAQQQEIDEMRVLLDG
jgi:uncharacterized protein (DUF305 family)